MNIYITGASGFVGGALIRHFSECSEHIVYALSRSPIDYRKSNVFYAPDGLVSGVGASPSSTCNATLIHCAARAHIMNDSVADPLGAFREANVIGTLAIARRAAELGFKRFIFISSIKVNGEQTFGVSFKATDAPKPVDAYGISKMEAEDGLREIAHSTGMELVIIRPPLVYGAGVKANFLTMMRLLKKGFPLPLGAIHNKRSLVSLGNLTSLIEACVVREGLSSETFLVSDGEDLSTSDLLIRLAAALDVSPRLIPVPELAIRGCAKMIGRSDIAVRLCGSLQVDITHTTERLDWSAPFSVDQGLAQAADFFLHGHR